MNLKMFLIAAPILTVFVAAVSPATATEYFVSKQGNDALDGISPETAFLTVERGVDALKPGDTLTIAPGEYFENVRRDKLGDENNDTLIRAEIPGTVVLRGDVPAPAFRKLDGRRYVYVADFDFAGQIPAVNELDTLTILSTVPNAAEPEFLPGTFHYDSAAKKLYVSTSDMKPVETHRYSVSVIPTHGFYLSDPKRVTIGGLGVTGFNALNELHYRERTLGGVWGMFLAGGKSCVIRDCRAWLNGWGIGLNSESKSSGDNVIERCAAWGNNSQFGHGDMGGLTGFHVRRDVIRDSIAFRNGMYGINIYGTGTDGGTYGDANVPGNDEANKSRLLNNLAWGNWCDFKIKTGVAYFHTTERCAGLGLWSVTPANVIHSLIGRPARGWANDNILLMEERQLDFQREFADPENHDYRLQATSRFRAAATDGSDRGPFPYKENIFYVRPDGDDAADGLSVENAWKTLARATRNLRPGDTVYLAPGVYPGTLEIAAQGEEDDPVSIRGRGREAATIQGGLRLQDSRHVELERLHFEGEAMLVDGSDISFDNCRFTASTVGLDATGVEGISVSHCVFAGFRNAAVELKACENANLRGNLYDNRQGVGLRLGRAEAVRYSDYNGYGNASAAWEVAGKAHPLTDVRQNHDRHSSEADAEPLAAGPMGKPVGTYRNEVPQVRLGLVHGPEVHSVSATTANIEWMTSLPATCELAWGDTPECANTSTFDVNYFGTYSLTSLKPNMTYYFRIKSLKTPRELTERVEAQDVRFEEPIISFRTLNRNPAPATYYVAPDGDDKNTGSDRQHAWKTIHHAAGKVNAGDTVLIAGGTYAERVRIRATGEADAPITFKCLPGEKVVLDGADKALHTAFLVAAKSHLRFDGLYFQNFNLFPFQGWRPSLCGEFHLSHCKDIQITRCFSDGLNGYTAKSISAWHVADLLVKNCVNTNKMDGAMRLERCPNLRIENCVFARPMIAGFIFRNESDQKAIMESCIFTDMLKKKAALNIGLFAVDYRMEPFLQKNCCYALRCFPPEERALIGMGETGRTAAQLKDHIIDPLFADPQFAGAVALAKGKEEPPEFPVELLMQSSATADFNFFFATDPEVVNRGIGLQPEAFKDFNFNPLSEDAD